MDLVRLSQDCFCVDWIGLRDHTVPSRGDRTRFFTLLEQQMIRAGLKNVGTSFKEARKRGSIA